MPYISGPHNASTKHSIVSPIFQERQTQTQNKTKKPLWLKQSPLRRILRLVNGRGGADPQTFLLAELPCRVHGELVA